MKLFILGDTHGNSPWVNSMVARAQYLGADAIMQVGDFGFWHGEEGEKYLDDVSRWACKRNLPFIWLDGNHENFDLLYKAIDGMETNQFGFYQIRPGLFYSPRGNVWEWDGHRFMTAGGAVSVDKQWRILHERNTGRAVWWPQEELTWEEVDRFKEVGKVDVLFTHDAPFNPLPVHQRDYKSDAMSLEHQQRVRTLVEAVRPDLHFHGHFHHAHDSLFGYEYKTRVIGLGCDGDPRTYAMLDTETLEVIK